MVLYIYNNYNILIVGLPVTTEFTLATMTLLSWSALFTILLTKVMNGFVQIESKQVHLGYLVC